MNAVLEDSSQVFELAIKQAKTNPALFFKNILGTELDLWQIELLEAVLDVERYIKGEPTVFNHEGKNKISVRAMHGPGKTFGIAAVMHLFNFIYPGRIVATAPKEKQLITRLWPAFRKIKSSAVEFYQSLISVDSTRITWAGNPDWVALAETAAQPENLAGYHDDFLLFLVEEASGVDEALFPVIEGALSTGKIVVFIMISNPTKTSGTFYDSHNRDLVSRHYYKLHVSLDKTSRVSRDWVQQMVDKYGKDSPVVQIRCYGNFAAFDKSILIQPEYIDAALDIDEETDGSLSKLRISIDVADGGADSTIITACRIYKTFRQVLKQKAFNFPMHESPVKAAEAAIQMYDAFGGSFENGDDFVPDANGVGTSTAGHLMKHTRKFNVIPFKGGRKSVNPERWRNKRVQSYMALYDAYYNGEIRFSPGAVDDEEEMRAHLLSIKRNLDNDKVDDIEPKRKIAAEGLPSPDRADSLMMLYTDEEPESLTQDFSPEDIIIGGSIADSSSY